MYTKAATIFALYGLFSIASAQIDYGSSGSATSANAGSNAAVSSSSSAASMPSQSGVHVVTVSDSQGEQFAFTPDTITAAKGDKVTFMFNPLNHSVVQGDFNKPCSPLAGGFFSGFMPLSIGATEVPTFTITVNDTNPIWFYCSQTVLTHCQQGMVGAINPPMDQTVDMFRTAASKTQNSISPPKVQGGSVSSAAAVASSSSASSSAASPSSTASAANSISLGATSSSIIGMLVSVALGGLFVAGMV